MKKIYILAAMVAFAFTSNAQIIDDEFDFYTLGDLSPQAPHWETWSGTPGAPEDAQATDAQSASGAQSGYFSGDNDMILQLGDYSSDLYTLRFDLYLNPDSQGFFGTMPVADSGAPEFALAMYINNAGSGETLFTEPTGNSQVGDSFSIPEEQWVTMTWVIDITTDTAVIDLDGVEVYNGQYYGTVLQGVDVWSNGSAADFYMDNLIFQQGEILATNDFTASNFSVYPNPVKDRLNISTTNTVDSVVVYDVLGKVVLSATPGVVSPSIDMSALTSGAYLVNITINGSSKTVKVVK
jgi:Secretion system C-terminal sorting domain